MRYFILSLIISLTLTILIEAVTSLLLGVRGKKDLITVVLANVCTNPVVVYIANMIAQFENKWLYNCVVAILEISAVIVEYVFFKHYLKNYKKSKLILSLVNNVISFSIGLIINKVF